ncbi:3-deoxy-D-manno-octulosonic acid transferase [bacterium]|nr:3-deoxy-D-manno-octulosonic acid transferase [bacterium]
MIRLIYSLLLYLAMLLAMPFFCIKALLDPRYRYRLKDRLGLSPCHRDRPVIWCHTASVGEVLLALPFFKKLLEHYRDYDLFVSTQTPSGHQTLERDLGDLISSFLTPLDSYDAVIRAVRRIQPALYIVFETELWPNLLMELDKHGVPLVLLNGRISQTSVARYRLCRFILAPILRSFTRLCMQSQHDADRLIELGALEQNVLVTGNLKYDRTIPPCPEDLRSVIQTVLNTGGAKSLVVLGSLHEAEFEPVLSSIKEIHACEPDVRFIVAARHLETLPRLEEMLHALDLNMVRRSHTGRASSQARNCLGMVLDTYGELASLYSLADIVFVGGSLVPAGGQNMLEPAYFKKPVLFGPHTWNFKDIAQKLIEAGAAQHVTTGPDLTGRILALLHDPEQSRSMGESGFHVISQHQGALDKTMQIMADLLSKTRGPGI